MTYVRSIRGNISESADSGDSNKSLLELLGGDLSNSVSRVRGGLQRDVVSQQTSNVGRGHGGSRDGVDSVLAANPSRQNVQTRGEDVSALSVVGEVGTFITQGGGTDGDGILGSGRRVVASISIVITSSDSKMNASLNSGIDSKIQSARATTTQGHVGNTALETLGLAVLSSLGLLDVSLGSPLNTLHDIRHGTRAAGAQDLHAIDMGLLGNTVLLAGNGTRAVSAVAVAILVLVTLGNGLSPGGTTFKVNVINESAGVNNVSINTLATILSVQVLVEGAKGKAVTVRDTGQTPRSVLLEGRLRVDTDLRVLLNILNLDK